MDLERGALRERRGDVDVETARVGVVDRRRDVLPVIAERRLDLLGRGDDHRRLGGNQLERRAKALQRQQLAEVRPLGVVLEGQLRQLPVLGGELGGRRELHPLGVAEGALGEGREPADRLDLVAEQLHSRRPVLGGPEHVEDPAPNRELPPLLHLVDALVAGLDQQVGDLAEVDLRAALEREARGPQRRVGHRLGERHGAGDDHRGLGVGQRVQSRDPQADEVRRRRHVGGVAGAPRRVVADAARRQVGAQLARQVARADVVGGHHQHRPPAEPLLGASTAPPAGRAGSGRRRARVPRASPGRLAPASGTARRRRRSPAAGVGSSQVDWILVRA